MNNKISELVKTFNSIRNDFLLTLNQFPSDRVNEQLFGDWTLKDVIAHFVGWDKEFTETLLDYSKGIKHEYWGKMYEFNDRVVNASKNKSWKTIYSGFVKSGSDFIDSYQKVPENHLDTKVWKDKIYTPIRILEINIHHYEKAQLSKIKKLVKEYADRQSPQ